MKLLFDANLSPDLITLLHDEFPNSVHVFTFNLEKNDLDIGNFALENNFAFVTKDDDLFNL
ncbi:MAG: DUF5615 family PIN-like protein [Leptospiraceae bacterium]|nr:DUF5615 family PIN-like protein [Leptospiraceae bacterium]MCP5512422.1 DUF5615 family PIN-like protein [Leptospiraceae bacterium]